MFATCRLRAQAAGPAGFRMAPRLPHDTRRVLSAIYPYSRHVLPRRCTMPMMSPETAPGSHALDLVSIGECLVEFNRDADGCFHPAFAGDAFNALFYAGRLGLRTGFISALGDDLFTPMIEEGITREGIDTTCLARLAGYRNGLYFIELDDQGEYTFHFWRGGSAATRTLLHHDPEDLAAYASRSSFLLLTGIGLAVLDGGDRLPHLLRKIRGLTKVVFDTNYRARLWDGPETFRRRMEEVLPFVDIFLPTLADLRPLYPGASATDMFRQFTSLGIGTVVMKNGAEGCAIWHDGAEVAIPPPAPVSILDATGAGDAFNAGLIAGMARGLAMEECCMLAHRVAARALRVRGAIDHRFAPWMVASDP